MKLEQMMRVSVLGPYTTGSAQQMGQDLSTAISQVPPNTHVTGFDHSHYRDSLGSVWITLIVSLQRAIPDGEEVTPAITH